MAYAVGRISGGHFNPAVTLGAALGGRLAWRAVGVYIGAQLVGGLLAGAALFGLMHGFDGFNAEGNMGANSFGDEGTGYALWAAFAARDAAHRDLPLGDPGRHRRAQRAPGLMGPLAIGLALTMIHLASMGATGTSVNPARSIGVGVFAGTDAIIQLWLFIVAPLVGAAIAGLTYPLIFGHGDEPVPGSGLRFGGGRQPAGVVRPAGHYSSSGTRASRSSSGARPGRSPAASSGASSRRSSAAAAGPPSSWGQPPAQAARGQQRPQQWGQPAADP